MVLEPQPPAPPQPESCFCLTPVSRSRPGSGSVSPVGHSPLGAAGPQLDLGKTEPSGRSVSISQKPWQSVRHGSLHGSSCGRASRAPGTLSWHFPLHPESHSMLSSSLCESPSFPLAMTHYLLLWSPLIPTGPCPGATEPPTDLCTSSGPLY